MKRDVWAEAGAALALVAPLDAPALLTSRHKARTAAQALDERPFEYAKSLVELIANPDLLREPVQVLPLIAVENATTLLVSREKTGKSTLMSEGAAALADGRAFLGHAVGEPGAVLWYTIDEPLRDTVLRFHRLVTHATHLFVSDAPRSIDDLLKHLRADLAMRETIRLVVIDTVSRALQQSGIDTNDARDVGPAIRALMDVLREFHVACVLIYHTGKSGDEYAGSVAIGATVDEIITLRRRGRTQDGDSAGAPPPDDGKRWLVCNGRRLRDTHALAFDGEHYSMLSNTNESRETRILRAALAPSGPFRKGEIAASAGGRRKDTLAEIDGLRARGLLAESGGRYNITAAGRARVTAPTGLDEAV